MERVFQDGDVVRLKSGGPLMTVVSFGQYSGTAKYKCEWFDAKHALTSGLFIEASLVAM